MTKRLVGPAVIISFLFIRAVKMHKVLSFLASIESKKIPKEGRERERERDDSIDKNFFFK